MTKLFTFSSSAKIFLEISSALRTVNPASSTNCANVLLPEPIFPVIAIFILLYLIKFKDNR